MQQSQLFIHMLIHIDDVENFPTTALYFQYAFDEHKVQKNNNS